MYILCISSSWSAAEEDKDQTCQPAPSSICMHTQNACFLFFKTTSSSVVKILEYIQASAEDGLCSQRNKSSGRAGGRKWHYRAVSSKTETRLIWPLNTALNSRSLLVDSSPVTASSISATQKGYLSRGRVLHLSCWHRAGDAHCEQGPADKQLPAPVTKRQDAVRRDPAPPLRRRLFYRQPPPSEVIMLRDERCASISEQADISGHTFVYSPETNRPQKGSVSQGRIAVRYGKHLVVERKHTYEEAVYSTK